jgi:hypothetical protein
MSRKSTNAEVERRVSIVYDLMLKGYNRTQIHQYVSKRKVITVLESTDPTYWDPNIEPSWDVETRAIDEYMSRARDMMRVKAQTVRDESLGRTLERREDMYKEAREHMDLKTALAIDQDTARLLDLYPEQKTKVSIEEINPYQGLPLAKLLFLLEVLDNPLASLGLVVESGLGAKDGGAGVNCPHLLESQDPT